MGPSRVTTTRDGAMDAKLFSAVCMVCASTLYASEGVEKPLKRSWNDPCSCAPTRSKRGSAALLWLTAT